MFITIQKGDTHFALVSEISIVFELMHKLLLLICIVEINRETCINY